MNQAVNYVDSNDVQQMASVPKDAVLLPINALLNTTGSGAVKETSQEINLTSANDSMIEINKSVLLDALAKACNFPDYCQPNWDSAFDCLTDSAVKCLRLDIMPTTIINTEDFNAFKSIIEDAYQDFGQPQLWVVTHTVKAGDSR